jgi:hypothetical protein
MNAKPDVHVGRAVKYYGEPVFKFVWPDTAEKLAYDKAQEKRRVVMNAHWEWNALQVDGYPPHAKVQAPQWTGGPIPDTCWFELDAEPAFRAALAGVTGPGELADLIEAVFGTRP